jgi:hypothetical protein
MGADRRTYVRREPCPKCGTPGVKVTHVQVRGMAAPTKVACPNPKCEKFDPRAS